MTLTAPPEWPKPIQLSTGRHCLERYEHWVDTAFPTIAIEHLLSHRAQFIDQLLQQLWQQCALSDIDICLIAVGGYGRGSLFPQSDIDLLFLHAHPLSPKQQQQIHQFVQLLWDLRLDVGHSVRTPAQCIEQATLDVTVATSLLEQRFLCGDQYLADHFQELLLQQYPWSSAEFYRAKYEEQQTRHQRYHGTAYNLEPNVKSNPGGLRDIQTIRWIAQRHFHTQHDEHLVQQGFITAAERLELKEYEQLLSHIRFALHLETKRKEERLLFEYQPAVAARLGYGEPGKRAVEAMMKDYFNAVVGVTELNDMLLQFFDQSILANTPATPRPLTTEFMQLGHLLAVRDNQVFNQPINFLRCMLVVADNPEIQQLQAQTLRQLRHARRQLAAPLSHDPQCRDLFMQLLRHPHGCGTAFKLLHQHQILAHYLPQWQQIVGQMQFDLFHAYTVDEHTYRLVRNLYRYNHPDYQSEFPLCAQIVRQMAKPELLYLAGIFHDIAKGRGGDHSELGAQDALNFAQLHQLDERDAALVAWLVQHHLLMSVTAQKRDIHDPNVISEFATQVGNQTYLDYLYCLTVADIRATNSSLWNNWKATLLENLYLATKRYLTEHKPTAATELRRRIQQHQAHAMGLLLSLGFTAQTVNELWSRFTADYFLRHQPEQIAWHSQHIAQLASDEQLPLILIGDENNQGTTELFVYHREHDNLFADIAAVLTSHALSIHDAQILATRDGYVMDTFVVLQENGQPLTDARRIEALKQQLYDVLRKRVTAPYGQRRLPRRLRNFQVPTRVEFLSERNPRRTTFELTALDRPGLVAQIAKVLQALDLTILAAKITTVGEQAEDLFIVSTRQHEALTPEQKQQLRANIITALDH